MVAVIRSTLHSEHARFWERRPGYGLAAALVVATGTSTILSLWWPFPAEQSQYLNMVGIRGSLTALAVWIYCLAWFVAQDAAKVLAYIVVERVNPDEDIRVRHAKQSDIARAIAEDSRKSRITRTRGTVCAHLGAKRAGRASCK